MKYWLLKSEPYNYSIDDLAKDLSTPWSGVRNYQARNFMRDKMSLGDIVLFYHSNAKPPGIVGLGRVHSEPYPDETARDPKSKYFVKNATEENPIWVLRDIAFVEKFPRLIPLSELSTYPELSGMPLLKKGMRLSIQPVEKAEFEFIYGLVNQ